MKNTEINATIAEQYPDQFGVAGTRRKAILGVSAFGHDSAAALVAADTGAVIFAIAEERLTNVKHDWHFPIGAIHACCRAAAREDVQIISVGVNFRIEEFSKILIEEIKRFAIDASEIDALANAVCHLIPGKTYFSPLSSSEIENEILAILAAFALSDIETAILTKRLTWYYNLSVKYHNIQRVILDNFKGVEVKFHNHHTTHAASAFYNSGFEDATVLTIDGSGEADTVTVYKGSREGLVRVSETLWPHSLGIFYYLATRHVGFDLGDEFKVMGMSAYGEPKYYPILREMFHVTEQAGLVQIETSHLARMDLPGTGHVVHGFTHAFSQLLPPRAKDGPVLQCHFDFASSVQKITEEVGIMLARKAIALTGSPNLAIAGGVGLNGLMNQAIRVQSGCRDLFVFPAAGDDGTCVGAAQMQIADRMPFPRPRMESCYFGADVSEPDDIRHAVSAFGLNFSEPPSIHEEIARALADGKVIARCQGRSEFGPRALGNRSIMANPGSATMKDTLNGRVKHREEFRPFAPACLVEKASEFFEIDVESPFMLLICRARERACAMAPAIVHADGTARLQTVSSLHNSDFHGIISAFERLTGLPIVLNTSFNVNGETIVETAQDAIESFGFMDIDYLAIGPFWVSKAENQHHFPPLDHEAYLEQRKQRFRSMDYGALTKIDTGEFDPAFRPEGGSVEAFTAVASVLRSFLKLPERERALAAQAMKRVTGEAV